MKKYIVLVLGMWMTFSYLQAADKVNHTITVDSDPYTCRSKEPVTLANTVGVGIPDKNFYFELERSGEYSKIYDGPGTGTYEVSPTVGTHTYVVASGTVKITMPPRMPQTEQAVAAGELPDVPGYTIGQYDVYTVTVNYHTEYHDSTVNADVFTNLAHFSFSTTAGTTDEKTGKTFCGMDSYYKLIDEQNDPKPYDFTNGLQPTQDDPSKVAEERDLPIGMNIFAIYILNQYNEIQWRDVYNVTVKASSCTAGLVYAKWDDFMFVDNGEGGGNGSYVAYQWYKDGNAIAGATKQWIRTTLPEYENAAPSGKYYVLITDNSGNSFYTCPTAFDDLPQSSVANRHKPAAAPSRKQIKNGQFYLIYEERMYDARGMEVH